MQLARFCSTCRNSALLPEELTPERNRNPSPSPCPLRGMLFRSKATSTYLEVLKGEEALRLGLFHPVGCLTSAFFLNPLGLACAPSAMSGIWGGQRHRALKVFDMPGSL